MNRGNFAILLLLSLLLPFLAVQRIPGKVLAMPGGAAATGGDPHGDADASKENLVVIKGLRYVPEAMKIHVGQTVTWTNRDDRDHTVAARDGSFKSGNLTRGESFSFQFKKPGTFAYGCKYHPRMKAIVLVVSGD